MLISSVPVNNRFVDFLSSLASSTTAAPIDTEQQITAWTPPPVAALLDYIRQMATPTIALHALNSESLPIELM